MMGREGRKEAQSHVDFITNFGTHQKVVAELARLVEENTDHYERFPKTKGYRSTERKTVFFFRRKKKIFRGR